MNLQELKESLNKVGFTEASLKVINEILDSAIARGSLTEEEKNKLVELIDIEAELADIDADTMDQMASALGEYAGELDKTIKKEEEISKKTSE